MHHTFNPDQVLAESRRLVNNPNVELTVDCLFYEGKLLMCSRNNDAWSDVLMYVGVSDIQDSIQQKIYNFDHWKLVLFCILLVLVYIGYKGSGNKDQEKATVSFEKFFVILAGKTNDAHLAFVAKLKGIGNTEVKSSGESDYLLVFCPVTSQVGADISEALKKLPDGKPTILVVMHHTFNPDQVVPESRRLVDNPNVYRTVDCLFQEDKLLTFIDVAQFDMQKFLGGSSSQDSGTIGG
ncbi:uncharacterized protein LOC118341091 [Morone saxatilis]|uniref:uncharacterized protein LOC118341091 n=1 Tax=Morone saxatilis TaxID=34816 RepID=UPI0015E1F68B|nr:uncharacterized protein LOC118341091 [Morone saxatilis]